MSRKLFVFLASVAVTAVFLAGCKTDNDQNRSVMNVAAINEGIPVFSDVLDQGDTLFVGGLPFTADDFVQEDIVLVDFRNMPFNETITTPTNNLANFLIQRYRVDFERVDGGTTTLPSFESGMNTLVPSNFPVQAAIVIVPFEYKNTPLLSNINYLNAGFPDEIRTIARITFTGRNVGSDREYSFEAFAGVNFADPVVESEN